MARIDSESQFFWKFVLDLLLLPFTLVLVLVGKRTVHDLGRPFENLFVFFFQAKFTSTIILVNILAFIGSLFLSEEVFLQLALFPHHILEGTVHTLFTAGFLHANVAHLFGNMLGIFVFGRVVERKLGTGKTAFIYFGALLLSSLFSSFIYIFLGDNIPGIGASGALMGLVAAAMLLDPFYLTYELLVPLPVMVVGWLTIAADIQGVLRASNDGIGHFAHIGGFLSVTLLLLFFERGERDVMKKGFWINIGSLAVLWILISGLRSYGVL